MVEGLVETPAGPTGKSLFGRLKWTFKRPVWNIRRLKAMIAGFTRNRQDVDTFSLSMHVDE